MFLLRVAEVTAPSESDGDGQNQPNFEPTFADLEGEFVGPAVGAEAADGVEAGAEPAGE